MVDRSPDDIKGEPILTEAEWGVSQTAPRASLLSKRNTK